MQNPIMDEDEINARIIQNWKKMYPHTNLREFGPFPDTEWQAIDACEGIDIHSDEPLTFKQKSVSDTKLAEIMQDGSNFQMVVFSAILGIGYSVLSFNDILDHVPSQHGSMVMSVKVEFIAFLIIAFVFLVIVINNKMK